MKKVDILGNEHSADIFIEFLSLKNFAKLSINNNARIEGGIDLYDAAVKILRDKEENKFNVDKFDEESSVIIKTYDFSSVNFLEFCNWSKEDMINFIKLDPHIVKLKGMVWLDCEKYLKLFIEDYDSNETGWASEKESF